MLPSQEANALDGDSDEEAEDDSLQANDIDLLEDFPDDTDVRTYHSVSCLLIKPCLTRN